MAGLRRIFAGIADEIHQNLAQAFGISPNEGQLLGKVYLHRLLSGGNLRFH